MLPTEIAILKAIDNDRRWPVDLEQSYDIPGEYLGLVINSFMRRGWVKRD